jgi:hypothetical protein
MKYFRYCSDYVSPYTNQPYGIFIAVWHLIRDKKATAEDEAIYWAARKWFESNLPIPPFYTDGNPEKALTWFKDTAIDSVIVRELEIYKRIAEKYGTRIILVSSEDPGRIIYEDEHQIAAIQTKPTEPNQALEPTRMLVTDPAAQAPRQAPVRLI